MIDSRYPNMVRIEEAPLDPHQRASARKFADEVHRRTTCNTCYDLYTHSLFLYYGEAPEIGPLRIPFGQEHGWKLNQSDIDSTVLALNMGRNRTREEKDQHMERAEANEKYQQEQEQQKFLDERRPEAKKFLDKRDKARRGVSSVSVATS